MKKTLIIDHRDSFTHLLAQYFGELGGNPVVVQHDETSLKEIEKLAPTHIVLSPGPGTVEKHEDFQIGFDVLEAYYKKIPILGVCLGHQAIWKFFGGVIAPAPQIMHGKRSTIHQIDEDGIMHDFPTEFEAMRYHSLMIALPDVPALASSDLELTDPNFKTLADVLITAWAEDGISMAIQHRNYPVFGVQFHPESIGTEHGRQLIENFLNF